MALQFDTDSLERDFAHITIVGEAESPQAVLPCRDPDYYMDMIIIETTDSLFYVPSAPFVEATGMPTMEPETNKVYLDVVSSKDLRMLLDVIQWQQSPAVDNPPIVLTYDDWLRAFGIAKSWSFQSLRQAAEIGMSSLRLSNLLRIRMGRELRIKGLLVAAYLDLIGRLHAVHPLEADALGMKTLVKVMSLREKLREKYQVRSFQTLEVLRRKREAALDDTPELLDLVPAEDSDLDYDLVDQVRIARSEGVLQWIIDAYGRFIRRKDPPAWMELKRMGMFAYGEILSARNRYHGPSSEAPKEQREMSMESIVVASLRADTKERAVYAGAVGRLALAKKYRIQEWFSEACLELIERDEPINLFEARVLGMDCFVYLCRARDKFFKQIKRRAPSIGRVARVETLRTEVEEFVNMDLS